MTRELNEGASDSVVAQPSNLFSVGVFRTKFQEPNCKFSYIW